VYVEFFYKRVQQDLIYLDLLVCPVLQKSWGAPKMCKAEMTLFEALPV